MAYNDDSGFMDDDESSPSTAQATMDKDGDKSDETEDQLALIPRAFFPNPDEAKPGTQWIVEVVNVYEGEVAIKYAYDDEKDKKDDDEGTEESGGQAFATPPPEDSMMT